MKITIIGWYGTETIGDRAILAGLFSFFSQAFNEFDVKLGSLYPFFSERTVIEDSELWKKITNKDVKVEIFDSKKSDQLDKAISGSDLLVMGGGPLMHISELYMVEYAFRRAKKLNKKTALLGCGIGPIFTKKYKKSLINIVDKSDLIILRDSFSKQSLEQIYKEFNKTINIDSVKVGFDPAVECSIKYNNFIKNEPTDDIITINLRKFPDDYNDKRNKIINNYLTELVYTIANKFKNKTILLMPMHYFHIGDDDRDFLNEIKFKSNFNNIVVQNENLSLENTMQIYNTSLFTIGMRFHSIVLQTILNGKNYVLDYTEPMKGKTGGFINDIGGNEFYNKRYVTLQNNKLQDQVLNFDDFESTFKFNDKDIMESLEIYTASLKRII